MDGNVDSGLLVAIENDKDGASVADVISAELIAAVSTVVVNSEGMIRVDSSPIRDSELAILVMKLPLSVISRVVLVGVASRLVAGVIAGSLAVSSVIVEKSTLVIVC